MGLILLNSNHLKVFNSVAKNLSFSKASEELYTSQSSVSVQIKKLEESLGIKLFEQLGKRIYLTEAGDVLYSYSQKVFALIKEAAETIDEIKGCGKGILVIGASTTPGVYLLPGIIGRFRAEYPGAAPRLQIANSQGIGEMVTKNMLDLGIIGEEFDYPRDLHVEPWIKDELFLILPAGHPLADRAGVRLEDLKDLRFVFREPGSSTRSIVEKILAEHNFAANVLMELNTAEAVKQAVIAGLGVSFVSRFSVAGNKEIAAIPVEGLSFSRMLNIVYHREKIFSPLTQKFLTFLKNKMAPGGDWEPVARPPCRLLRHHQTMKIRGRGVRFSVRPERSSPPSCTQSRCLILSSEF